MTTDKIAALRKLVEELEEFLDSGLRSGIGQDDEPPSVEDVLPGGPVNLAVVAVESACGGRLPPAVPGSAWVRLCRGRPLAKSNPVEWDLIAKNETSILLDWAERELRQNPPADSLSQTQRKALEIIKSDGPIQGKTLAKKLRIAQATLRKHVLPKLREFGVQNHRSGDGYFYEKPAM